MSPNFKGSQEVALMGVIPPQSATTAKSTGWIDISAFRKLLAVINVGAMTATGTLDGKLQQDDVGDGTHAKDVTGKALTQVLAASGSNTQYEIDVRPEDLDFNNGFKYVSLTLTPATAASLIAAEVLGFDARYGAPGDHNPTSVKQTV